MSRLVGNETLWKKVVVQQKEVSAGVTSEDIMKAKALTLNFLASKCKESIDS